MPTLPDYHINAEGKDGTPYNTKVKVSVLTDGTFSVQIPDDLADIAARVVNDRNARVVDGAVSINAKGDRVYAKCLAYCTAFLRRCAKALLDVETVTDRVIVYRVNTEVSFYEGADGSIHANGCDDDIGEGKWWAHGPRDNRERIAAYTIGLGVRVFDRTTFKRPSGDTVKWDLASDKDDEAIGLLNAFTCLSLDPDDKGDIQVMPYTPEAAKFFSETMLAVCRMARSMRRFFEDKERLLKAINSPTIALPFGPSGKDCKS